MADAIDLAAERTKRAQPVSEFVTADEYGRKFYKFTAEYMLGNDRFAVDFWAADEADAQARVEAMKQGLQYCGQLYHTIQA